MCNFRITRNILTIFFLLLFLPSCTIIAPHDETNYGLLKTAVWRSTDFAYGEYVDYFPDNFDQKAFEHTIKGKLEKSYYDELMKHSISVFPKGSYYLLVVRDHPDGAVILFDYSCSTEIDGPVQEAPDKYDLGHVEKYNPCE
jgi:hypothetical protein